jgi:small redox-active disulfide protein 2
MKIEVLGPGCARCATLHDNARTAVRELGLACEVEKVTDMQRLLDYNVLSTPALVVDGQVKAAGRVLSPADIKALLG